ncbi:DoxX family membrane protein [Tepidibacillus infernus]|uniref:DoxX family membrane protein n=1 Tax=Tepidibacillus infernus TaxID=1806172 RepID=UPI003A432E04
MKKKIIASFVFFLIIGINVKAFAHVKWFNVSDPVKVPLEEIITPAFMITAMITAIILAILSQATPYLMKFPFAKKLDKRLESFKKWIPFILRYGLALALLIQILNLSILAPDVQLNSTMKWIGILTMIMLAIPYHLATKIASLLILILFGLSVAQLGWFSMLDYGFYLAIAYALFTMNTKWKDTGTPALYLGTGLSLSWVAVEKWVFPGMSTGIVEHYQLPTFGFSPEMFVMLAAYIEFVVGYLLVVGILNRLLALVVTLLFILTTSVFGGVEVAGHFIVHIILIIFIIEGVGYYKPPIDYHKRRIDKLIFVVFNFIFVLATMIMIYYRFA